MTPLDRRVAGPKDWIELRCVGCRRLLARVNVLVLPVDVDVVEIKCGACKRMNYARRLPVPLECAPRPTPASAA